MDPLGTNVLPFRQPTASSAPERISDELPLGRLLNHGAGALADAELLAMIMNPHSTSTTLERARSLLGSLGGLNGLIGIEPERIERPDIPCQQTASILAALELSRRIARGHVPDREPLSQPAAVARFLLLRFGVSDQEVMGALYLDIRHRLLAEREIFRGTLNRASVEPRALLKQGLLLGAAAMVLFHTHPSGDPAPSAEDLVFTKRLCEAGELVGVKLLDHLILGGSGAWVSLRERGGW